MEEEKLDKSLKDYFSKFLSSRGFELVDIEIKPSKQRNKLIRFLVDKPGGIILDECVDLNNEIGQIIDDENLIERSYILEVASPGLDRPLRRKRDFERTLGKKITVVMNKKEGEFEKMTGQLVEVKENIIKLNINNQLRIIPLDRIQKAKLKIDLKRI